MPQKVKIKQEEIVEKEMKMAKDEMKIKRGWPMIISLKNIINSTKFNFKLKISS